MSEPPTLRQVFDKIHDLDGNELLSHSPMEVLHKPAMLMFGLCDIDDTCCRPHNHGYPCVDEEKSLELAALMEAGGMPMAAMQIRERVRVRREVQARTRFRPEPE